MSFANLLALAALYPRGIAEIGGGKTGVHVPHKGPQVAMISKREAEKLYALRGVLEGYAAHEFAKHGRDDAIAEFGRAVEVLREAAISARQSDVLQAKTAPYDMMLDHCGNHLISEILTSLHSRGNLLGATSLMNPRRMPSSLAEIEAIYQALKRRDAEAAQCAATLHVENACKVAVQMLQQQL